MNNNRLDALLLAETVRLVESEAPLDDAEANRHAAAAGTDEQRLLARAGLLGRRLGLQEALQAWRARIGLAWVGLAALVFLAGYGLIENLLGAGRTINAVLAFMVALGVHFLSLALWLLSLPGDGRGASAVLARFSLGNLSLWLAERLGGAAAHRRRLPAAALALLERARLLPWLLGLLSHVIWAAAFLLALLGLWFMFSFREYRLSWETTILSSGFFTGFIDATGMLPRLLGFSAPDADALAASTDSVLRHRALAYWLMGCIFTYGLLPRVLLALLSAAVVARRRARLALDTADPYFRKVLARIDEIGRTAVVDPAPRAAAAMAGGDAWAAADAAAPALVGFELPPECAWPPPGLGAPALSINVSGAGDQLRDALRELDHARPSRILFVCDLAASPDRGTARFLRQAAACGQRAAILLLGVRGGGEAGQRRWQAWLAQSALQDLACFGDAARAAVWLEGRHD